jgi:hypothetical protein
VLEVHLATYYVNDDDGDDDDGDGDGDGDGGDSPEQVVPVVRELLQREVPGVQLLVTWEECEDWDDDDGEWDDETTSTGDTSSSGYW